MTQGSTTGTDDRARAVQTLFEGLVVFSRSLRARGAEWGDLVGDLSRGDIVALGALETRGPSRPGQLATALAVDPSVISRQVVALQALGLVVRGPDPADGRAELITLTEAGHTRLAEARGAICAVLAQRLDHWGVEDIARAAAMVADLDERLHDPVRPS